jgi:Rps23 Pro-64 3,4-dihydroxylase Tpa1-like proline 4-hydroxylase
MKSGIERRSFTGSKCSNDVQITDEFSITIRGHKFNIDELVCAKLHNIEQQEQWATQLNNASPFPHLAAVDWFNPDFLQLILEEFDLNAVKDWREVKSDYVNFRRSVLGDYLGPATELYFSIINSSWFVLLLSKVSSIQNLIVDHTRYGGGMHETVNGGHFSVHSDFNRHVQNGLANKMVFITYLTPNWQPDWGGELELWDAQQKKCVNKVAPKFGQSLLMINGPKNFHGHPSVWNAPFGVPRRSIANYYYVNEYARFDSSEHYDSVYVLPKRADKFVAYVRPLIPPVLWQAIRKLAGRP